MPVAAVITGQLRTPALLHRTVEDLAALRRQGHCQRIILSTWDTELAGAGWVADLLARRGVEVLTAAPLPVDTYRNYRRQRHLLDRALRLLEPDDVVVKLRPDWVVSRATLARLCAPPDPVRCPPGFPRLFRGRITVPWWGPRVPFHLADESLAGYVADVRLVNPPGGLLALADPHAARYLPALVGLAPVLRFAEQHVLPHLTDATPDRAPVLRRLGRLTARSTVARPAWRRLGPARHELTTLALSVPTYQRALACYFRCLEWFFRIHNPRPLADQFIARHGPWRYATADVSRRGNPVQAPDPVCYVGPDAGRVAARVPAALADFHAAFAAYTADPALVRRPPEPAAYARDAAAMRRLVRAYRWRRLGVSGG